MGLKWTSIFFFKKFPYPTKMKKLLSWSKIEVVSEPWVDRKVFGVTSSTRLHYLLEGRVGYDWAGGSGEAGPGDLLWSPPGKKGSYQVLDTQVERITLHLRVEAWAPSNQADTEGINLLRRLDDLAITRGPRFEVSEETSSEVLQTLRRMVKIHRHPEWMHHRVGLKGGAMGIISLLFSDPRLGATLKVPSTLPLGGRAVDRVEGALHYLNEAHIIRQTELKVEDIARWCGYRPSRFHSLFLEATGTTPQRYLTERRIHLACDLLLRSQERILDVALACGFRSQSRFYQAFVNVMGSPPALWRRKQRVG